MERGDGDSTFWNERWANEARAARALGALQLKDKEIHELKRLISLAEESQANATTNRESRLEKKISQSAAKVTKLEAQLDANRRTNQKLTDEKLEFQANCRAAQERAAHAEGKVSELIGRNTALEDEIKEARKIKGSEKRESQHTELKQARSDLVAALQKNAEYETKLAGVKAQRETLSNQLREGREQAKNYQFSHEKHAKAVERFQVDLQSQNETLKEKENQISSQSVLINQLQTLHRDAQNLLKQQELQHKSQLESLRHQQRKLILFSQKLEKKRDEDKKEISRLSDTILDFKKQLSNSQVELTNAAERRNVAEKESLSLRLELQQMLDEAQMSDTKRNVVQEEKLLRFKEREAQHLATIEEQKTNILQQEDKYAVIEDELKTQMKYNKQVIQKCESLNLDDSKLRYKLKQKDDQIGQLRKKNESLEIAVRQQIKRSSCLQADLNSVTAKVVNIEKSRDRAILNAKALRSENFSLETAVKKTNEKLEVIELEGIKSKYRKRGLNEAELDISRDSEGISLNGKAIIVEIKLLRKSLKKLDADLTQIKRENEDLVEENQELRQLVSSHKKDVPQLEALLDERTKDNEKMRRNLNINQERVRQLSMKLEKTQAALHEAEINENVNDKLKNAETRLKNVMKDNSTLKQRIEDVTHKYNQESNDDAVTKAEIARLNKDLTRKRGLIEDFQSRMKAKEKQIEELLEKTDSKADELESKTSGLQQSKRANENLRRQISEMKLEKDSLYVELTSVRSQLSQLEASKAEADLGLKKSEENLQTEIENFEKASKKSEERQRQGLQLLQSKMAEAKVAKDELAQTVKNILEIVSLKIDQKQKENFRKNNREAQIPEACTEKVCDILNISNDELNSIMEAGSRDHKSVTSEFIMSITEVILAGPPFTETITNSFRQKLSDLISYYNIPDEIDFNAIKY